MIPCNKMWIKFHVAVAFAVSVRIMHHPVFILGTEAVSSFLRLKSVAWSRFICEPRPTAPSWEPSRSHWPLLLLSSSSLSHVKHLASARNLSRSWMDRIAKSIQIKYIQMKALQCKYRKSERRNFQATSIWIFTVFRLIWLPRCIFECVSGWLHLISIIHLVPKT